MSVPEKDSNSIKLSKHAESDWSSEVTGLNIFNSSLEKRVDWNLASADFNEFRFPWSVFISPLWEINLKGWASFHDGKVLVENLECTIEKLLSKSLSERSG